MLSSHEWKHNMNKIRQKNMNKNFYILKQNKL
jgi:hypothetical protein